MSSQPSQVIDDRFQFFRNSFEDVSILREEIIEHRPLSQVKKGQRIDIAVPRSGGYYYDLARSFLRFKVKITKSGGGGLVSGDADDTKNDHVAHTNHAPLFVAWSFYLENIDFARETNILLPYKMNLDFLLRRSREYLESTGASSHFFFDTSSGINATKPSAATGSNAGLLSRYEISKSGNYFTIEWPLSAMLDLAQSLNQYVPNGLEIRLSLFSSADSFNLQSPSESELYESHIDTASLCLMAITPRPELLALHSQRFLKSNAKFTFEKSVLKSYTIATGSSQWDVDSIFSSFIPATLILVFVKTAAYVGSYQENCFNYLNLDITRILYKCEGIADKVMTPDFKTSNYVTEYMDLYRDPSGAAHSGIITLQDYKSGYTIFKINNVESMFETKKGINRLSVRFGTSLTDNITAICYGIFPDSFEMDANRLILN